MLFGVQASARGRSVSLCFFKTEQTGTVRLQRSLIFFFATFRVFAGQSWRLNDEDVIQTTGTSLPAWLDR
jgi:hypothetical protein